MKHILFFSFSCDSNLLLYKVIATPNNTQIFSDASNLLHVSASGCYGGSHGDAVRTLMMANMNSMRLIDMWELPIPAPHAKLTEADESESMTRESVKTQNLATSTCRPANNDRCRPAGLQTMIDVDLQACKQLSMSTCRPANSDRCRPAGLQTITHVDLQACKQSPMSSPVTLVGSNV